MVCLDCNQCKGKPPLLDKSNSPESVKKRIVAQIENIVRKQDAQTLDLNQHEYFEWRLLEIWREAESQKERNFRIKTDQIFEALTRQRN